MLRWVVCLVEVDGFIGVGDESCEILAFVAVADRGLLAANEDSAVGGCELEVLDSGADGADAERFAVCGERVDGLGDWGWGGEGV